MASSIQGAQRRGKPWQTTKSDPTAARAADLVGVEELSPLLAMAYHNVWFECHEDFLVTLGRTRAEESSE